MSARSEWELGRCSECGGQARRVPDSPFGTWTHSGQPCRSCSRATFVPGWSAQVYEVSYTVGSKQHRGER